MRRGLIVAGAVSAALALALWALGALGALERAAVDARFALRGERPAPEVAVVDIDGDSLTALDDWPISRTYHGRVIDRLRRARVRGIAYDVQFSEPSDSVAADSRLIESLIRTPGVVLATTEVDETGATPVLGGDEVVREVGARVGNALYATDPGGVIRRQSDLINGHASFSAVAAGQAVGKGFKRSGSGTDGTWIDYAGGPGTVLTVPFERVLRSARAAEALRGRVVVVGSSAPSLQDVHATSTSGAESMSGPEIQANAIATAMRGYPLHSTSWLVGLAALLLACTLAPLAFGRLRLGPAVGAVLVLAAGWLAASQLAFDAGRVLPLVPPLVALGVATLAAFAVRYTAEARERRRVRAVFGRFDAAVATAREMLEIRLPRSNASLESEGVGTAFRMGIGLDTSLAMPGDVGSERRLEYAAIGDTTNVASRLEAMTKGTPHQLYVADATRAALTDPARFLDSSRWGECPRAVATPASGCGAWPRRPGCR